MENINLPHQPQTESEFAYVTAFGDELSFSMDEQQTFLAGDGLLSKIIGTKKSRQAVLGKITAAPEKLVSKVVGTEKSRAIVKGKVTSAIKTVGLAPSRGAFLGLLAINAFGLASDLKKEKSANSAKWNTVRNVKWAKWGGNRTELDKTVDNGSKRTALKINFKKSADGYTEYDSVTGVEDVAALITASAPLVIAVFGALGKKAEDAETQKALEAEAAKQNAEMVEAQKVQDQINGITTEEQRSDMDSTNLWLWIGGGIAGVLLIGIIIYAIKGKK